MDENIPDDIDIVSQAIVGLLDDSPVEMVNVNSWEEFLEKLNEPD